MKNRTFNLTEVAKKVLKTIRDIEVRDAKRYLFIVILWVLFTAGCLIAPILAIFFFLYPKNSYLNRVVKSADRMMAAILGYSGKFTASVESATEPDLVWLRDMLDTIKEKHCENEVFSEGAYCSIKTKKLGDK